MARRAPYYEVARTAAGWTARYFAGNGPQVWTTSRQAYSKRKDAFRAIELIAEAQIYEVQGLFFVTTSKGTREVRVVDER